jgi:hypothetical protein
VRAHERGRVVAYLSSIPRACAILSASSLAAPHFSTLSHKQHNFRKKKSLNIKCVFIFSTNLSKVFLILRRIQRDIVINMRTSTCKKKPVIFVEL